MVSFASLLLPILVAAVLVFLASSVIHMLLPYHRTDFGRVPVEDQLMAAMRSLAIAPGEYMVPHAGTPAMMKDPAFLEKRRAGPVAILTVIRPGDTGMGK